MLPWIALLTLPARAAATLGADWVPLGRADLATVLDGGTSETGVAESDGLLVPPLSAWAGWVSENEAVLGGLGLVRFATRTAARGVQDTAVVAALRPSVDYRHYLRTREAGRAAPYVQAGGFWVFPAVRYSSDAWTAEEQAAWDELAGEDRARVGGFGLRAGAGGEVLWESGLSLGLRWSAVIERTARRSLDEVSVTMATRGEAALVVGLTF